MISCIVVNQAMKTAKDTISGQKIAAPRLTSAAILLGLLIAIAPVVLIYLVGLVIGLGG